MATTFNSELMAAIPSLRAFARALTRNPETADDLVQEALTRAIAAKDQYTLGTNFRAWIFRITRNLHFNDLRRRRFQPEPLDEISPDRWSIAPAQHSRMELEDLARAFSALSPEHREVLILIGAGGFTYEEAADICGCVVGTIKSRASRARRELMALLSREDFGSREDCGRRRPDWMVQAVGRVNRFPGRPATVPQMISK